MRTGGDIAKAIACGADAVMIGSPLTRAYEAPGRGYHWGMATFHPTLPRGARVKTQQVASIEEILVGPAHENDGTFNLFGALATSMATTGYANDQGVPEGRAGHRAVDQDRGQDLPEPAARGDGPLVGASSAGPRRRPRGAVRAADRAAGPRGPRLLGDRRARRTAAELAARRPAGIILSGGPASVYEPDAPQVDPGLFELGVPVLGICYGHQLMAQALGGEVGATGDREYGAHPAARDRSRARCCRTCPKRTRSGCATATP